MKCYLEQVDLVDQMFKVIDYKKVDMSDDEYSYYKHLIKIFSDKDINGDVYFKNLFDVDKSGLITLIKTEKSVPWAILFFMQQLMLSQRLRSIDKVSEVLSKFDKRLKKLEDSGSNND